MHTYTCLHIHTHTTAQCCRYISTHTQTQIHICMHSQKHAQSYKYLLICTHRCSNKNSHTLIHTHPGIHTHALAYKYVCTPINTLMQGYTKSHIWTHRNTHMHTVGWNRCSRPASCTPTMNPRGRMPSLWSIVVSPASSTMHRAGLGVFTTPVGRTRLPNPSLPSRGFGKVGYTKEKWYLFPPIYFLLISLFLPTNIQSKFQNPVQTLTYLCNY